MELMGYVISAAATVFCGILAAISQKEYRAAETERKKMALRAEERKKESMLLLQLVHADCSLTVGTALALKRGHCNGELEKGLEDVRDAMEAYDDFHNKIALNHLNK